MHHERDKSHHQHHHRAEQECGRIRYPATGDVGASISSGSFQTMGMLVAPCSIKSLSGIVNSYGDNLLTRAADVCLKERRRLVLLVRETPLHLGHIELLGRACQYGAVILPPVPAFYNHPEGIEDIVNHSVGKALDQFEIAHRLFRRWKETVGEEALRSVTDQ